MPDHGRGDRTGEANAPNHNVQNTNQGTSKSLVASMIRWLQIKKYQYEVTFSLYMLTSTEKFVFNAIILVLFSLLIAAAVFYLPNHIAIVSNRLWYYVHGEFLYATAVGGQGTGGAAAAAGATSKEGIWKVATSVLPSSGGSASQSAEEIVRLMHEL